MLNLKKILDNYGQTRVNYPLSKASTFRIGARAIYFIEVTETPKLIELLNYLSGEGIAYQILGGGTNILMSDALFEGVVIKIMTKNMTLNHQIITAEAGVNLGLVVNLAVQNSLSGLAWAIGIPGTIGGAVRGNAGAMGQNISNLLMTVTVWQDGEVYKLKPTECGFKYRSSIFKDNQAVLLAVELKLSLGDKAEIMKEMTQHLAQRKGRYPILPSAGSFFKNIQIVNWPGDQSILPPLFLERGSVPAGWLIEQCNLKGYRVGDAGISQEHGNFIVNHGEATQANVLAVVAKAKEAVYNKYDVELEPEVEIIK